MYKSLLIVLVALLSSFRMPDVETDKMIMRAAEGQLPIFLAKINPDNAAIFGFTEDDDLDDCSLGKPYRTLEFDDDFYMNDQPDDKDHIVKKNEWRVPVMVKEYAKSMLTVSGNSGNYVVLSMGDTLLAKDPMLKYKSIDENDSYYLLRIPKLQADFFVHEANNSFSEAEFVPLTSAIAVIPELEKTHKASYTLNEVEEMVKKAIATPKAPVVKKAVKKGK